MIKRLLNNIKIYAANPFILFPVTLTAASLPWFAEISADGTHYKYLFQYLFSLLIVFAVFLIYILNIRKKLRQASKVLDLLKKSNYDHELDFLKKGITSEFAVNLDQLIITIRRSLNIMEDETRKITEASNDMHKDSISAAGSSRGQAQLSAEVIESVSGLALLIDEMAEVATEQGTDLTKLAGLIKSFSETSEYIGGQINGIVQEANLLAQRSLEGREILARVSEEMITTINQTGEINEVLLVISDISDRINLLSLNASIEAARAGDAGRGFAVVADEVSKLADQTANSVNDIGRMIEEKNRKLASNTDSIKLAVNNVEEVMIKVQDLSGNLKKIEKSVIDQGRMNSFVVNEAGKISDKSENIENTSIEQKLKIYETINVVKKVDALSADILEKADKLSSSADGIKQMTDNFRKFIEKIF